MFREIERFQARAEDGTLHTVIERETVVQSRPISGPARTMGGAIDSITADGLDLNVIEDGVYEIVNSGEIIRRID